MTPPELISTNFSLTVDRASPAGLWRVIWSGRVIEREADTLLAPYFRELMAQAQNCQCELLFDFTELAHFNSSAIAALMRLIHKINVRLTFHYDASKKWQRLTFAALRHITAPAGRIAFTNINQPPLA